MHRIDHATREIDGNGAGKDGFTEGSPGVTPPTVVTADIANALQEEIANAIEARGIALSKPDNTQLKVALSDPLTSVLARIDVNGEWKYPTPKPRTLEILPTSFEFTGLATADGIPWLFNSTTGKAVTAKAAGSNRSQITCQINRLIPANALVTEIWALIKPGATRTTPNTVAVNMRVRTGMVYAPGSEAAPAPTLQFSEEDDGTTNLQSIPVTGGSGVDMSLGYSIWVDLISGSGDTNDDEFYGLLVAYTDAGPINT